MSDYISDEIEDLEERLGVYLKGLGGHPGRNTLLSKKIKNMEKQLDILKKAKAFDNLVDVAYWHFERIHPDDDHGLQYESFYDDIRDKFRKYESGESNE